jgi:hypothetical protein
LRLTATLPENRVAEFCAWRRTETGAPTEEIAVMAGMAAAAFRPFAPDAPLVVAAATFGRTRNFAGPDRVALGGAQPTDGSADPALVLRDLRGVKVTDLHLGVEAAPVLSVMQRRAETLIALECAPALRARISHTAIGEDLRLGARSRCRFGSLGKGVLARIAGARRRPPLEAAVAWA